MTYTRGNRRSTVRCCLYEVSVIPIVARSGQWWNIGQPRRFGEGRGDRMAHWVQAHWQGHAESVPGVQPLWAQSGALTLVNETPTSAGSSAGQSPPGGATERSEDSR